MQKPAAIIFDVDGTIADSERYGHLPACNEAFRILGLPLQWEWPEFRQLLGQMQGNANRLRHVLRSMGYGAADTEAYVEAFIPIKKELYINKYVHQTRLRTGVEAVIATLVEADVRLAIVSTSHERQIHQLLATKLPAYKDAFQPVLGKESGQKTGDAGMLYEKCLDMLGLPAADCLVFEDSAAGYKAARKAGIPTIVVTNDYTAHEDFTGALQVATSWAEVDVAGILAGKFQPQQISTEK
ncbi:MAG TPA: HAD family hydrolase [Flammeovirgaceae bacterium]|nr:HAD family hydrolase [Flammeovirgaceae bacterium]